MRVHVQVVAKQNVRFVVAPPAPPPEWSSGATRFECLVTAVAMDDMDADTELIGDYGDEYWTL